MSTVASALVAHGRSIPLGVLPLGTLNHFAKDLGLPLTLAEAAGVIGQANVSEVDVGMLNDRVFINNSSLGVYPRLVLERDSHRGRFGLGKWPAMLLAILKTFRRFPMVSVRIETPDRVIRRKSPLVFVGNNEYQLDLLKVGARKCLNGGNLALYVTNAQSRWGMLCLSVRALFGRLNQARDFEAICLDECWIETRRRRLHVALDGEVIKLHPPLHYRILPGALRVFLPPTAAAVPPVDRHQQSDQASLIGHERVARSPSVGGT